MKFLCNEMEAAPPQGVLGSNEGPRACGTSDLPLSYTSGLDVHLKPQGQYDLKASRGVCLPLLIFILASWGLETSSRTITISQFCQQYTVLSKVPFARAGDVAQWFTTSRDWRHGSVVYH